MADTTFLERDSVLFSKILLSKEVANIIKHIVQESTTAIHPNYNDVENVKGIRYDL